MQSGSSTRPRTSGIAGTTFYANPDTTDMLYIYTCSFPDSALPQAIWSNATKLRHFKALVGSDPAVRSRVLNDESNAATMNDSSVSMSMNAAASRPVSAPVRRPMSAGYASSLRGKIKTQSMKVQHVVCLLSHQTQNTCHNM
jgi:hypothetical protein